MSQRDGVWLDKLSVGQRLYVRTPDDERWQERYLVLQLSRTRWIVASPTAARPFIEDLVKDTDQVAVLGPRGGLPTGVRNDIRGGKELVQFGEDDVETNLVRWERRGAALAAKDGVGPLPLGDAAGALVPAAHSFGFRIPTKLPAEAVRGAPLRGAEPRTPRPAAGAGKAAPAAANAGVYEDDGPEPFKAAEWVAAEDRGGLLAGEPIPGTACALAISEDRAIVQLSSGIVLAAGRLGSLSTPRAAPVQKDLRTLHVQYQMGDGVRQRVYGDAVKLLTETPFADWKVSGPRTAKWLLQAIASQGYGPVQRHYWWRSVQHLTTADLFVDDHLFISELLEAFVCFDQLNASEISAVELVARRYQLYEEYYGHSLRCVEGGASAEVWLDERQLFLGQDRGRGKALVCPLLEEWVAERLKSESAVLKERRKGREERMLASPVEDQMPAGGGGAPAAKAKAGGHRRHRQ
jgi:hypothetical protein